MSNEAITNNINEKHNTELQKKYGIKYKAIRDLIIKEFKLIDVQNWKIHYTENLVINKIIQLNFCDVEDYKKGFYDPRTKTISISDWAFNKTDNFVLAEIIIHELLHANGYKYHDEKMFSKVNSMMKQLRKNHSKLKYLIA